MKTFLKVPLVGSGQVTLFTDKIVAVSPEGARTLVYCLGSFSNGKGIGWAIEMDYESFMALLSKE